MKRVLITNLVMQRDIEQFRSQLAAAGIELVLLPVKQFLTEAELLPIIGQFDGVVAGDDQFTERLLRAGLPRLKVISKWGVGLDSIDLKAAKRLGIQVYNSPGAFGEAVAEVAIGYMLMLSRQLHIVDKEVRLGNWPKPEGGGLSEKVLSLVGFGSIGRAITTRALAFGMIIKVTDIRLAEMAPVAGVRFTSFDEVLTEADFLCLCCNLTPENEGLIGEQELTKMKSTAYLLNLARGTLVDETALIHALHTKMIAGAALDVYEIEPLPAEHPFTRMENVILGSHNANNLRKANDYVNHNSIRNLLLGLGIAAP
jgi:D-3-phosphoglycerate dehydrogenase